MRDAEKTAISWLKKLNNKQYKDCWNMLSETTQSQSNFKEWNASFIMLMEEVGDLISRKYYLAEIEKELEGLPEGLYVTVRYQSAYANTESAEEIVILTQLQDGQWSIHGYGYEYQLKDDNGKIPKSKF